MIDLDDSCLWTRTRTWTLILTCMILICTEFLLAVLTATLMCISMFRGRSGCRSKSQQGKTNWEIVNTVVACSAGLHSGHSIFCEIDVRAFAKIMRCLLRQLTFSNKRKPGIWLLFEFWIFSIIHVSIFSFWRRLLHPLFKYSDKIALFCWKLSSRWLIQSIW